MHGRCIRFVCAAVRMCVCVCVYPFHFSVGRVSSFEVNGCWCMLERCTTVVETRTVWHGNCCTSNFAKGQFHHRLLASVLHIVLFLFRQLLPFPPLSSAHLTRYIEPAVCVPFQRYIYRHKEVTEKLSPSLLCVCVCVCVCVVEMGHLRKPRACCRSAVIATLRCYGYKFSCSNGHSLEFTYTLSHSSHGEVMNCAFFYLCIFMVKRCREKHLFG